jgi:ArsR family transcriptional regulator
VRSAGESSHVGVVDHEVKGGWYYLDESLEREVNLLHASVCQGLSDPKRILILYALYERPMHVNELAEALRVPQPTVSRHLKVLRERQLVAAAREGPSVLYSLADERVIQALDILRGHAVAEGNAGDNMD